VHRWIERNPDNRNQSLTNPIKKPTVYYTQRIGKTIIKAEMGKGAFVNLGGKAVWDGLQRSLLYLKAKRDIMWHSQSQEIMRFLGKERPIYKGKFPLIRSWKPPDQSDPEAGN
jgi:hypothetical protein